MGYYSDLSGEMSFSRVLTEDESVAVQISEPSIFVLDRNDVTSVAYGACVNEEMANGVKAYDWDTELQNLISSLPADVAVSGYFERVGEEHLDVERLYVSGREVVSVRPEIVWTVPAGARA